MISREKLRKGNNVETLLVDLDGVPVWMCLHAHLVQCAVIIFGWQH